RAVRGRFRERAPRPRALRAAAPDEELRASAEVAAAERASRSEGGRGSVTAYGATGQGSESAQVLANRLGPIAPRGEIGGGEIRKGRGVCCNARLGSIHTSSRAWRELPRVGPIDEARPDCTKRREKRGFDG